MPRIYSTGLEFRYAMQDCNDISPCVKIVGAEELQKYCFGFMRKDGVDVVIVAQVIPSFPQYSLFAIPPFNR